MTRCRVSEDLINLTDDISFDRMEAIEVATKAVYKRFSELVKDDGFNTACYWLGGVFSEELLDNVVRGLCGDDNSYFDECVSRKAEELVDSL